jgi:hypothetical protein
MQEFLKQLEDQQQVSVKEPQRPERTIVLMPPRYTNSDVGAVDDGAHSVYSQNFNTRTVINDHVYERFNTLGPEKETNTAPEEPERKTYAGNFQNSLWKARLDCLPFQVCRAKQDWTGDRFQFGGRRIFS